MVIPEGAAATALDDSQPRELLGVMCDGQLILKPFRVCGPKLANPLPPARQRKITELASSCTNRQIGVQENLTTGVTRSPKRRRLAAVAK